MRSLALVMFAMACGGSASSAEPPIERAGFDLSACGAGKSTFDGITAATAVDSMELRVGFSVVATRGKRCARATDATLCEQSVNAAQTDGWPTGTNGGMPAPEAFIVATRGDAVESVGRANVVSFLGALDAADAAFLAEIATRGRVDCARPSVRKVDRGFEVITTTVQMCGGGRSEQRVFVSATGIASVRETRVLDRGEEMICP